MYGTPTGAGILIGNRGGDRKLLSIHYEKGEYVEKIWDTKVGTANILRFVGEEGEVFVATNREINEITFYYTQELVI